MNVAVTDCQTANNVNYCYCAGDLCNAESVPAEEARPAESLPPPSPDDEDDLYGGSGYSQESSETSGTFSRMPATHDDVTVDETIATSASPDNATSTRPRNAAFGVFANSFLLPVSLFVKLF